MRSKLPVKDVLFSDILDNFFTFLSALLLRATSCFTIVINVLCVDKAKRGVLSFNRNQVHLSMLSSLCGYFYVVLKLEEESHNQCNNRETHKI